MLRITPSTSPGGAKRYFGEGLSRSDYYIDGQEAAGLWCGKAAQRLGLSGRVDAERYFALCDNLHPATGKRLTARTNDNRRVGYDWTFSAPKAVSVLYELTGDERIFEAFQKSIRETLQDAEAEMKTRVRKGFQDTDRTAPVAAVVSQLWTTPNAPPDGNGAAGQPSRRGDMRNLFSDPGQRS